ncbi:hypothetical protein VNO78_14670 [Psophocarpus tetragonolobus]|uniref:Uncharacterized protein n=1 Tax=Psophocarpus tetragonolobus TaxID=3891 RepID=A0AAN9SF05_PSOTE
MVQCYHQADQSDGVFRQKDLHNPYKEDMALPHGCLCSVSQGPLIGIWRFHKCGLGLRRCNGLFPMGGGGPESLASMNDSNS